MPEPSPAPADAHALPACASPLRLTKRHKLSAGGLFHLPRSAAFRAGAKVVLFAQANRLHASVLARRVALGAVAFYFCIHLVGHAHLCGGLPDEAELPQSTSAGVLIRA